MRLLAAAEQAQLQLYYLMETLASTGVRISELQYVTVKPSAQGRFGRKAREGQAGPPHPQAVPGAGQKYCRRRGITAGPVFVTGRGGLWTGQHRSCTISEGAVEARQVFPTSRHLCGRLFMAERRMQLADAGHTQRGNNESIYIMESGAERKRQVERLGLVL